MHDDMTPAYLSRWWAWKGWRLAWSAKWCGTYFDELRDESGEWRRVCGRLAVLVRRRK